MSSQPIPEADDFEAWNERMSRRYDPDLFHTKLPWVILFLERQRVNGVVKYVDAQADDRILEVGCGAGNVLERIPVGQLYGIDLSDYLLEKAKNRLGKRAIIEKAKAEDLPFEGGYFSKVYCTEVLEHVLDPEKVLREMARVLAPKGVLVVSVPNDQIIVTLKRWLKRLGLYRLLLQRRQGYQAPESNEWHRHEFTIKMLRDKMQPLFHLDKLKALPSGLFPLHFLARGTKKDD
jgi:ubiquinone/menaquinone biosynthesis C-methylase UbiE